VERHCTWEGNSCKGKCDIYESEIECRKFGLCFWVGGNETLSVNPKCVMQVYEKIVFIFILYYINIRKIEKNIRKIEKCE
jgi:hypothetical protein